ncbi:MAG: hypothetical protein M1608_04795 [Candidatus Omnitrophica bacterium]|nr:hypothetical protein [Candidatus Omnitrophota bacterium]
MMLALPATFQASLLAAGDIPKLRPPHPLMAPTFWELHGWTVIAAVLIAIAAAALLIRRPRRPKPALLVPPATRARLDLEAWTKRPEDAWLASEVSRIMRRYLVAALDLNAGELTTDELVHFLGSHPRLNAELASETGRLLRECDLRKFAPSAPARSAGIVARALPLIAAIDALCRKAIEPDHPEPRPVPAS